MKKNIKLSILALLSMCMACSQPESMEPLKVQNYEHSISIEKALSNLDAFLGSDGATRSSQKKIKSVTPIKFRGDTRNSELNCENLIYVVNFDNDEGYALLAADDRIEDPIIAVTESGQLPVGGGLIGGDITEMYYYEGYPRVGPGFYTLPERGDEILMNPNTVNLYDSTRNEYMVGDFDAQLVKVTRGDGSVKSLSGIEKLLLQQCIEYAESQVIAYSASDGLVNWIDTIYDADGNPRLTEPSYDKVMFTYLGWRPSEISSNLLDRFKAWGQGEPFNLLNPIRYNSKEKRDVHAPAGCFPLSIAKIQTLFWFPVQFRNNDFWIKWSALYDLTDLSNASDDAMASATHLLRKISTECQSLYFGEGTFTFPSMAQWYMSDIGFKRVRRYDFNFNRVREMIDAGKPVIVYSVPGLSFKALAQSHCWNIDGYKIMRNTVKKDFYKNGVLVGTQYLYETKNMVHCDLGWYGSNNGYYVEGVFKMDDPSIEYDAGHDPKVNYNYSYYNKIITYEKGDQ